MPVELCMRGAHLQKAFIMERDRYDAPTHANVSRAGTVARLDRLIARRPILAALLQLPGALAFTYPGEHDKIRVASMKSYSAIPAAADSAADDDRVCQGTLVSRAQYLLDIGQYGYQDARLVPRGNMTPEDVIYWTWAIEHVR